MTGRRSIVDLGLASVDIAGVEGVEHLSTDTSSRAIARFHLRVLVTVKSGF